MSDVVKELLRFLLLKTHSTEIQTAGGGGGGGMADTNSLQGPTVASVTDTGNKLKYSLLS